MWPDLFVVVSLCVMVVLCCLFVFVVVCLGVGSFLFVLLRVCLVRRSNTFERLLKIPS